MKRKSNPIVEKECCEDEVQRYRIVEKECCEEEVQRYRGEGM